MKYLPLVVVALLVFAIVVLVLTRRARARRTREGRSVLRRDSRQQSVVPVGTLDMSALLSAIEWPNPTSQEPVLVDMQDGTALVLGDRRQALTYGEVIGEAGPRLVRPRVACPARRGPPSRQPSRPDISSGCIPTA